MSTQLIQAYAQAKSTQDINAALALCTEDFRLYTHALGIEAKGQWQARKSLHYFFRSFPDYQVTLDESLDTSPANVCTGNLTMTMKKSFFGQPASGKTLHTPFVCLFFTEGDYIAQERFYFSEKEFCDQLSLDPASLRRAGWLLNALPASLAFLLI